MRRPAVHAGLLADDSDLIDLAKRKIPIFIQVGDRDPGLPVKAVRETRDALTEKGIPVELIEMPNHDHWYYDLAPKINRAAWDFLKKYELESDPIYRKFDFND